jgi:hypothetical protein
LVDCGRSLAKAAPMPVVPPVIKAKPYVIRFLPFHGAEKISSLE